MWIVTYDVGDRVAAETVAGTGLPALLQLLQGLAHEKKMVSSVAYVNT